MRSPRWPLVAAIVALAVVGTYAVLSHRAQRTEPVDAELVRLGAAGLPTKWDEALGVAAPSDESLATALREIPEDDGLRDVYAAVDWLETTFGPVGSWNLPIQWDGEFDDEFVDEVSPERSAALAERLTAAKPFFDRVDAGLAKPRYRLRPGTDTWGLPNARGYGSHDVLLQMLPARAAFGATTEERLAAMSALVRFARRIEPRVVHAASLARFARDAAIREARRSAERGTIPAADLRRALDAELSVSVLPLFPAAARGQPAWIAAAWPIARTSPKYPRTHWAALLVRDVGRAFRWSRGHDCSLDHGDPLAEMDADQAAGAMRFWADAASIDASSPASFRAGIDAVAARHATDAGEWAEVVHSWADNFLRRESASRLACVALAAKAHHEATGAWPASLDELAPALGGAVPTDPRTDNPFEFEVGEATVRIRAAGEPGAADAKLREQLLLWEFRK